MSTQQCYVHDVSGIAWVFLRLGLTSFGGPVAHLGYFRREFVVNRKWLDEAAYADMVALCQFLPGPASSQVAFAIGMLRGGVIGAIAASVCFLLPSAMLMIGAAYGATRLASVMGDASAQAAVRGLHIAAAAVVMQAIVAMAKTLTPDVRRAVIAVFACAVLLLVPIAWMQVVVIGSAMVIGLVVLPDVRGAASVHTGGLSRRAGAMCLAVFVMLLVALPIAARVSGEPVVRLVAGLYQSGSLVFGGGHVVLPLLHEQVVTSGLVREEAFFTGYGAAQLVPGPLFSFAAFLGTSSAIDGRIAMAPAWLVGAVSAVTIFVPAWLLAAGAWPFWRTLGASDAARRMLAGANAAVVGVLLAALVGTLLPAAVRDWRDGVLAAVAFAVLQFTKAPAALVVLGCVLATWAMV